MDEKKLIERQIFNDTSSYNDIMDQPYQQSKRHLPMEQRDRAFQFAPFGALEGFNDLIKEKTQDDTRKKYTDYRVEEKIKTQIDYLEQHSDLSVDVNYFNDESGYYEHTQGVIGNVDAKKGRVDFGDDSIVINNIREIKLVPPMK
jgi:hypothetical protein